jgi:hypothetical protein
VPRVRDLLARFRPAGSPGAATTAGVPADRRESVARELDSVFAELAPAIRRCAIIRGEGTAAAARCEVDAAERAQAAIERARSESGAERAATAAALRARVAAAASESVAEAEAEAARVRRRADQQRDALVAKILSQVRADLMAVIDAPEALGAGTTGLAGRPRAELPP